jgi:hypothetical protein
MQYISFSLLRTRTLTNTFLFQIVSLDAFQNKVTVLVFCEGGVVQEIEWPDDGKFDTAHSFEIKGLKSRIFKFQSIKSRLRVSDFIFLYFTKSQIF